MSRTRAVLLVALGATLFSTSGLLIKLITISPLALVGARGIVASIVIAIWLRRPRFTWSLPQVGGGVALALAQIFFVIATRETTAANAIFIQYTAPVLVAVFGIWFLGERAKSYDWLTMGAIGIGLYLIFSGDFSLRGAWGEVSAMLSGISFAWLFLFLRKQKDTSTTETVLLGNIVAAVIGTPFLFFESPTLADWGGILFLGVLQLGIPFIILSLAIKQLTAVEAIMIQTLEPILNPVWVFLVIGETPTSLELTGGLVVLFAVTARGVLAGRQSVKIAMKP
jgi:drug/metabolite transporter (DMT)-like permease